MVDVEGCRIGIGIVIRDSTVYVMASNLQVINPAFKAQAAETIAIFRGIQFGRDCGLTPYILELDVAVVVKRINKGSHLDSASGVILLDISSLISEMNGMRIDHVPR
ncbi:hypothetical protein LWI29_034047 [Acer saccharum]|uniref:RNase H type-1 domain-containing protein n=1 Tax=Acer saccharum TaxID=4024 RepID=A0AA39SU90_ACESA|nr:hypothetical protein LWI29_034047 [Acer saccharum]